MNFFFNFVFDILNKEISDKFNEILVKKFVVLCENIVKDKELTISNEIIENFLEKLKNIIHLKYDNEYQNLCFVSMKSISPIWLFAAEELLKITPVIIENYQINQAIADVFKAILTSKKEKKSNFF